MHESGAVILVIEDEWLVRDQIVNELQGAGWEVLEASTGEGALGFLHPSQRIDIVFTVIQLSGYLSGWDVAELFRAARTDIPVIYASGNSVDRSRRVPGSLFFNKPYATSKVLQACDQLV